MTNIVQFHLSRQYNAQSTINQKLTTNNSPKLLQKFCEFFLDYRLFTMKVARKFPCLCNFTRIVLTWILFAHIGTATEFIDTSSSVTENFRDNRTYRPILHSKDVKNRYEGNVSANVNRISDVSKQDEEKDTRGCPGCENTSGGCNTNQVSNSIPFGVIIGAIIVGIVWIIVGLAIYFAFLKSFGGDEEGYGYGYGYNRRNEKLPPVPDFNKIDYSIKNSNLNRYQYKH